MDSVNSLKDGITLYTIHNKQCLRCTYYKVVDPILFKLIYRSNYNLLVEIC